MKVMLSALDRIMIPELLPKKGSTMEQMLVREIIDLVRIPSKEWPEYELVQPSRGALEWHKEKILIEKEFVLNPTMIALLQRAAEEANQKGEVNQTNLDTIIKIQGWKSNGQIKRNK